MSAKKDSQPGPAPDAEARLAALLAKFAPGQLGLIDDLRHWLKQRLPGVQEVVYEYKDCAVISYSPSGRGYEGVFSIRTHADGVRLYFTLGKDLPDPAKLLRGAARVRWLALDDIAMLARPEVARLVEEAIARNTVPFGPAGEGLVVIRSG